MWIEGETKTRQSGIDNAIDKNQQNAGNKLDVSFADGLTAARGGMPVQQDLRQMEMPFMANRLRPVLPAVRNGIGGTGKAAPKVVGCT